MIAAAERESIVRAHAWLVKFIAQKIHARLPMNIDLGDLIQMGMFGLLDAIDRYDPSREAKFKTYAEWRIRGAIFDGLRALDIHSRSIRDRQKEYEASVGELRSTLGRNPRSDELAEALNIGLEELFELEALLSPSSLLSVDDSVNLSPHDKRSLLELIIRDGTPEEIIVHKIHLKRQCEIIYQYIERQNLRDRGILESYFFGGMLLIQIAKIFRVTESRVSQIVQGHSVKIRRVIEDYEKRGFRGVKFERAA